MIRLNIFRIIILWFALIELSTIALYIPCMNYLHSCNISNCCKDLICYENTVCIYNNTIN